MPRALRILAALFATAAVLLFVAIVLMVSQHIVPILPQLAGRPGDAIFYGLFLGYGVMLLFIYLLAAVMIWRRRHWNMAMLLAIGACFGFPIGPILGFSALFMLTRPGVRASFSK